MTGGPQAATAVDAVWPIEWILSSSSSSYLVSSLQSLPLSLFLLLPLLVSLSLPLSPYGVLPGFSAQILVATELVAQLAPHCSVQRILGFCELDSRYSLSTGTSWVPPAVSVRHVGRGIAPVSATSRPVSHIHRPKLSPSLHPRLPCATFMERIGGLGAATASGGLRSSPNFFVDIFLRRAEETTTDLPPPFSSRPLLYPRWFAPPGPVIFSSARRCSVVCHALPMEHLPGNYGP